MINVSNEQVERVSMLLRGIPHGVEKALTGVINRAKITVRSKTTKSISAVYAITQKDIRAETNINMSTYKNSDSIVGIVNFSGNKIPLYRFNVTPKLVTPRAVVSAAVLRSEAPKPLKNAFVAEMKNPKKNHMGVFERISGEYMTRGGRATGKENKHTEKIGAYGGGADQFYGPSTAQMAANSVVLDDVESAANETINKRLEAEINRILNGYGVK